MNMSSKQSINLCRFTNRFVLYILTIASLAGNVNGQVYKSQIKPQWSADNSHFWYRNDLAKGQQEFVLVDLKKEIRRLAFDHAQLATSLEELGVKGVVAVAVTETAVARISSENICSGWTLRTLMRFPKRTGYFSAVSSG